MLARRLQYSGRARPLRTRSPHRPRLRLQGGEVGPRRRRRAIGIALGERRGINKDLRQDGVRCVEVAGQHPRPEHFVNIAPSPECVVSGKQRRCEPEPSQDDWIACRIGGCQRPIPDHPHVCLDALAGGHGQRELVSDSGRPAVRPIRELDGQRKRHRRAEVHCEGAAETGCQLGSDNDVVHDRPTWIAGHETRAALHDLVGRSEARRRIDAVGDLHMVACCWELEPHRGNGPGCTLG